MSILIVFFFRQQYNVMLRVKLSALARRREKVKQLAANEKTKNSKRDSKREEITRLLEEAVTELQVAASKSLENATAKLETIDMDGNDLLTKAGSRLTDVSGNVLNVPEVAADVAEMSVGLT